MENNDEKFLRIGTQIYLKEINPSGQEQLLPWSTSAIYQDYGKDRGNEIISHMPKYVGWANEPSHANYKEVIGKWLNLYQPLPYKPCTGMDFPHIRLFIKHVFGNQYELGMDYLQLLYLQPKQKLPILMLVSRERNTGKSTFLKLLKAIFGANATFNTNEDFKSQFNSDWANKLLIMVDEAFLDKVEYTERLKNLSTAIIYKAESKGKDRFECDFHGKFILCSNNVERPVIIEPGETRFWVIQVPKLKSDDTQLLNKMIYEIPAFLELVQKCLNTKDFKAVCAEFDSSSFSLSKTLDCKKEKDLECSRFASFSVLPLQSRGLYAYLTKRKINTSIARQFLQEAHYSFQERHDGRYLYALAYQNDKGGYELRGAPYTGNSDGYKGGTSPKGITTHLDRGNAPVVVFEGIFDMLSFATLCREVRHNYVVMNSIVNRDATVGVLKPLQNQILLCLDNDNGGENATRWLMEQLPSAIDIRERFAPYKDVNDYLLKK